MQDLDQFIIHFSSSEDDDDDEDDSGSDWNSEDEDDEDVGSEDDKQEPVPDNMELEVEDEQAQVRAARAPGLLPARAGRSTSETSTWLPAYRGSRASPFSRSLQVPATSGSTRERTILIFMRRSTITSSR